MKKLKNLKLHPLRRGFDAIGVGTTKGYEIVAEGRLDVVKIGHRSYVTDDSLRAYIQSLPKFVSTARIPPILPPAEDKPLSGAGAARVIMPRPPKPKRAKAPLTAVAKARARGRPLAL